jgi:hypothetical protein
MFYYVINVPRVIEFESLKQAYDFYLNLGLYKFTIPPLEISLMMLALLPFFLLIKSKRYLKFNREE